jgi:hypothetical protein
VSNEHEAIDVLNEYLHDVARLTSKDFIVLGSDAHHDKFLGTEECQRLADAFGHLALYLATKKGTR